MVSCIYKWKFTVGRFLFSEIYPNRVSLLFLSPRPFLPSRPDLVHLRLLPPPADPGHNPATPKLGFFPLSRLWR
ncbi:hypothetical protein RchiOBHm_Chr2g0114721 [Rosa chinensis]|nr:hypothetical protein RchiOBHm_Chr2g0114721 [Rosa chinensis]